MTVDTPADRIARLVAYMRTPGIEPSQVLRAREQLEQLAEKAGIPLAEALAPAPAPACESLSKPFIFAHPAEPDTVSTLEPEVGEPPENEVPEVINSAHTSGAALEQKVSTSPRAMKITTVEEAIRANPKLSDRAIARACGVSPTMAGRVRMRLGGSNTEPS